MTSFWSITGASWNYGRIERSAVERKMCNCSSFLSYETTFTTTTFPLWSRDWLSTNQGPVFPNSIGSCCVLYRTEQQRAMKQVWRSTRQKDNYSGRQRDNSGRWGENGCYIIRDQMMTNELVELPQFLFRNYFGTLNNNEISKSLK